MPDSLADALLAVVRTLPPHRQAQVLDFAAFLRAQEEAGDGAAPSASEDATRRHPVPNLHPGAMVMHDDFDDPLPEGFWLGEQEAPLTPGEREAA
jgi:hypothetical protein